MALLDFLNKDKAATDEFGNPIASTNTAQLAQPVVNQTPETPPININLGGDQEPEGYVPGQFTPKLKPLDIDLTQAQNFGSQEELRNLQQKEQDVKLLNELGKSAELMTTAISGTKPTATGIYESNIKGAEDLTKDYKERLENAKFDPNSTESKFAQQFLKQSYNMDVTGKMSANDIYKFAPMLKDYYNTQMRQQERQFATQERLASSKEHQKQVQDTKNDNWISQRYDNLIKSSPYKISSKIKQAKLLVDNAINNPSAMGDVGALYSIIKALDPESVVREGEIKLANQAKGLWGKADTALSQISSDPRLLNPKTLKDIKQYVDLIDTNATTQYDTIRQPVLKQAKSRGISEERFSEIDPLYSQELSINKTVPGQKITSEQKYDADKERGINAVMKNHNMTREEAINALKKSGKL